MALWCVNVLTVYIFGPVASIFPTVCFTFSLLPYWFQTLNSPGVENPGYCQDVIPKKEISEGDNLIRH